MPVGVGGGRQARGAAAAQAGLPEPGALLGHEGDHAEGACEVDAPLAEDADGLDAGDDARGPVEPAATGHAVEVGAGADRRCVGGPPQLADGVAGRVDAHVHVEVVEPAGDQAVRLALGLAVREPGDAGPPVEMARQVVEHRT